MGRFEANVDALEVLQRVRREDRPPTEAEEIALARWSSWGATGLAQVFDEAKPEHEHRRARLRELLSEDEYSAARRTTINAHYTAMGFTSTMWELLERLEVAPEGRFLEPGCGSGAFLDTAPPAARLVGVELDPVSAQIAQLRHPTATVRQESFADTKLPRGYFDGVIGNVPFGDVVLHDPLHNANRHALHNHFILKSLALTRPGGIVAVLTSHHTLDSKGSSHRSEMHQLADLVGAVRLPSGAHEQSAGTEAVTDLVVFRRRGEGEEPGSDAWVSTTSVEMRGPGEEEALAMPVNNYFVEHPEQVLGESSVRVGMYGVPGLHVQSPHVGDVLGLQNAFAEAAERVSTTARANGLLAGAPEPASRQSETPLEVSSEYDGHITALPDGRFTVVSDGLVVELQVPKTQRNEVRHLLQLRDLARELIGAENDPSAVDSALEQQRTRLHEEWSRYVDRYGPINRFSLSKPKNPQQAPTRIKPGAVRLVQRTDPYGSLVAGLECFDSRSQTAEPAGLLLRRQVVPRTPMSSADSPSDALSVSLDQSGGIDLELIARLLDTDTEDARRQLDGLVFDIPTVDGASEGLVTRAEYLSGNVRAKLDVAHEAAGVDDRWKANVEALKGVLPADLTSADINAAPGAVWIPDSDHTAFMQEVFNDRTAQVTHVHGSEWVVEGNKYSLQAVHDWGTNRLSAPELFEALIKQKPIVVRDRVTDGEGNSVTVLNHTATEAAQERAERIVERFKTWVWEDPERSLRLQAEYNRRFNSLVLRDYAVEGRQLTLPGLAQDFSPRPHQKAAIARMLNEPSVGLFHEVGAGKTAEMIIGATELRRLGMVRKPAFIVPNHMLEQFEREWLQLYPNAALLVAGAQEVTKQAKADFVARAATNEWDGIIFTRTAFQAIALSPERASTYEKAQIEATREALARIETSGRRMDSRLKQVEKQLLRDEERLKRLLDAPRAQGVSFEETGIDYLVIDEMHDYKNLGVVSSIPGAGIDGSKRAQDLHAKLWYLREQHGERVATAATATPIANSVTEMYVMQRYLAPEQLTSVGIEDFDSWAATFGEVVTGFEANVTGDKFQLKARFARFQNVPELLTMFHSFGDVKTAEDLQLPTPKLMPNAAGERRPEVITVPQSQALASYIESLSSRVERIQERGVDPSEDNMLKVSSDGKKAALDMRLVIPEDAAKFLHEPSKVDYAAAELAKVWEATRNNEYIDPATGSPSPQRGALQLVFCDMSVPGEGWNVYDELRAQLEAKGLPAGSVRFIHEANSDEAKARLFEDARAGRVAVLIGSTAKMGTGTNVQDRVVHVMHLDSPWRPADVRQREGRGIRQGNQNAEVKITQVITEGSFDTFMWQTLERKGRFIDQIMCGRVGDGREIEDISEATLSYGQFKALASGNPLLLELAEAENDLGKLTRLRQHHVHAQASLKHQLTASSQAVAQLEQRIPLLEEATAKSTDTSADKFRMTIGSTTTGKRPEAAETLRQLMLTAGIPDNYEQDHGPVAQLGGHTVVMSATGTGHVKFTIQGLGESPAVTIPLVDIGNPQHGLVTKLENLVGVNIRKALHRSQEELETHRSKVAHAQSNVGAPFGRQDELDRAEERYARIQDQIAQQDSTSTHTPPPEEEVRRPKKVRLTQASSGRRFTDDPVHRQRPSRPQPPSR